MGLFKTPYILILSLVFITSVSATPNTKLPTKGSGPWIVDVYYDDLKQLRNYAQKNEPWHVNRQQQYFTLSVENLFEYQELFSYGFRVEINQKHTESSQIIKNTIDKSSIQNTQLSTKSIPGFACYRTVEETFSSMDSLATSYPNLASVVDIGNTWNKETPGGLSGYDMRVLKITNSAITGDKPKLFVISSIHARELTPAELNTRFAEFLLNNYGTDADATWLVDHREIHLLLQGNPDGRKIAEAGNDKRKNENNLYCSNQLRKGIDMNRNFGWMWNQGSGSSSIQCDQTFRGPSAQSENENTAIDSYAKTLFIDARGPDLLDVAPSDTTGVYIDVHSYSELVLWPYGFDSPGVIPLAPNHNQLQTLGRKFSWYNNYFPQASNELYGADGASDDNAYGQLGVASYTFELGTSFSQSCDIFENNILPNNLKALIYAAKVSDTPYITAQGPDIENLALSISDVVAGTQISVSGIANDTHFNNINGTEPTQNILSVEMYIDQLPWDIASTPIMISASDGDFNSNNESFTDQIDTTGMNIGQHVIYLQSTDSNGITGVVYSKFFNIVNAIDLGALSGIVKDASTNLPIEAVNLYFNNQQTQSNASGLYDFSILSGTYDLSINKQGYAPTTINNLSIIGQQTTNQNILLQPICALLDENTESFTSILDAQTAGWTHAAGQGVDDWSIDLNAGNINQHAFKTHDAAVTTDKWLISPSVALTADSTLEFWHKFSFEGTSIFYDGAVLEISTNDGSSWQDLGAEITNGGYNVTLANGNPLSNQPGWGGTIANYTKVEVNLSAYAGTSAKIRWRFAADSNTGAGDWLIDDIKVLDPSACTASNEMVFFNGFE